MRHFLYLLPLPLLLSAACSSPVAPTVLADAIPLWEAADPAVYNMEMQIDCFCAEEVLRPARVFVQDDRVVRVVDLETGEERPQELVDSAIWPTVPDLFIRIRDAQEAGVPVLAEYDPRLGYPTRVEIGHLANDAGVHYTIFRLEITESTALWPPSHRERAA